MSWRFTLPQDQSREILIDQAKALLAEAQRMMPGPDRDQAMKHARSIEAQANADKWASSTGLQAPD